MQASTALLDELTRTPKGALRILARDDDRQILIVHGEERAVGAGERLAHVSWFSSVTIASLISKCCSQFLDDAKMPADADGWHCFAVEHIKTLVAAARTHLHVTVLVPEIEPVVRRREWTLERVARLGFLAGLGWTAKRIADDPLIASTPNNVYRQAHRFGISLSDGPQGQICARLPLGPMGVIDRAARAQRVTPDAVVRRWLIAATTDPQRFGLLDLAS